MSAIILKCKFQDHLTFFHIWKLGKLLILGLTLVQNNPVAHSCHIKTKCHHSYIYTQVNTDMTEMRDSFKADFVGSRV